MRILQVIPSLIRGGAERLVLDLSLELEKLGHEVLIVQLRPTDLYPELSANRNIALAESSVQYSILGEDVINTDDYEQVVSEFEPEIIHSHLIDSELVTRHHPRSGIAYLTHWHGCPELTNPILPWQLFSKKALGKWNTKRILRSQYRKCHNHFLCISDFIGTYVRKRLRVGPSNLTVIRNAIDLNLFSPLDVQKKEGFRLISIGSLQKNKNHRFLCHVVKRLVDQGINDVFLDVYGVGPEMNTLHRAVRNMGLAQHIAFHGNVNDPEIQLNRSHVLVHSAWHEPFGLVLIEAMACGIPVVSFKTGGPGELVQDGKTGYLINNNDLKNYAERIATLYRNPDLRSELGRAGLAHAKNFGLSTYAKNVETLYERLLSRTGTHS